MANRTQRRNGQTQPATQPAPQAQAPQAPQAPQPAPTSMVGGLIATLRTVTDTMLTAAAGKVGDAARTYCGKHGHDTTAVLLYAGRAFVLHMLIPADMETVSSRTGKRTSRHVHRMAGDGIDMCYLGKVTGATGAAVSAQVESLRALLKGTGMSDADIDAKLAAAVAGQSAQPATDTAQPAA